MTRFCSNFDSNVSLYSVFGQIQVKAEDDAESDDEEERRDPDMDFSGT